MHLCETALNPDIYYVFFFLYFCCCFCFTGNVGYDCNFEQGVCSSWVQDKTDTFDWTLQQGGTASSGTGPSIDHTLGTSMFNY